MAPPLAGDMNGFTEAREDAPWLARVPDLDRRVMERSMATERSELRGTPALLVIDVLVGFTGTTPKPIMAAIDEYSTSCGQYAWDSIPRIEACIDAFRQGRLPIIWIRGVPEERRGGIRATRGQIRGTLPPSVDPNAINALVAPTDEDMVVEKRRASAFFETSLDALLKERGVDSLVVSGCTTSGCVRASAVDAFSLGYEVFVAHDACFDRSQISHDVSLFDMGAKYATVLAAEDVERGLEGLREG